MRTISLVEGQGSRHLLDHAELAAIRAMRFVEIGLTPETGIYELQPAKNKVGALSSSDVQVLIHPKVAVSRLFWLMDFAEQDVPWTNAKLGLGRATDLTSAIAHSFLKEATRSVEQILRGYVPSEDTSQVLRGRLSISRQIKRHMGMPIPMEIEYDDFIANVTENRILLAAAVRCSRMPTLSTRDRQACRALIRRLESSGVHPSRSGETWRATRLNQHYHVSLRLADMILKSESFAFESGGVSAAGFIIDMWSVFEDFVVNWLRCYMGPRSVSMSSQHVLAMDTDFQFKPRADLYLSTPRAGVFVDAKYKSLGQGQPPISDVYQMHSYCIAARSKVAHLVYVGSESSARYTMNNSDVTVHRHSIDLSADTAVLNAQLERIAGLIAEGLGVESSNVTHAATSVGDHRSTGEPTFMYRG